MILNWSDPAVPVAIDVQPSGSDNRIDPTSPGLVAVALLGSATFGAAAVDEQSLAFGPAGATAATPGTTRDANRDDFPDLVVRFRARGTGVASGDGQVCLSGRLSTGNPFRACDAIETIERGSGKR